MMSSTSDATIFAEGPANDNADGHVHRIALDGEVAKLLEHTHDYSPRLECEVTEEDQVGRIKRVRARTLRFRNRAKL